jgi:polysaccharide pyruvyl transferase CsaB
VKVLISGYYGFANLGDEAILEVLTHTLKEAGHQLTVLSADSARTQQLHNINYNVNYDVNYDINAVHRLRGMLPALLRHDVLIAGGGGLLQDATSRLSLEYYLTLMRLAKRAKKRVIVYGQSIGPLSRAGERSTVNVLKKDVTIAVRDRRSQRYLASHGLEATLTADPALLLEVPSFDSQACEARASSEFQHNAEKPLLIIPRGDKPEIQGTLERNLAAFSQKPAHRDLSIAVMALSPGDQAAARALQQQGRNIQLWHADSPKIALRRIAAAKAVLSVRLHGLILAAAAGVPYSGIAYDPKVQAFLDETGARCWHLPEDEAALQVALGQVLNVDWSAVDEVKTRARAGLAWLLDTLAS